MASRPSFASLRGLIPSELQAALETEATLLYETETYHFPTITAASGTNAPGQQPTLVVVGSILTAQMTLNTDAVYRVFKIPLHFRGNPQFHVHWTKSGDADESGKVARWEIACTIFEGNDQDDVAVIGATLELEDTYEDNGTTTRHIYRTADAPCTETWVPGWYVGIRVRAITPVGTPMASEPALVGVDLSIIEETNA